MDLAAFLTEERERVDGALNRLLAPADAWPARLHQAMRYAVFGGGKRVRPGLARAAMRYAGAGGARTIVDVQDLWPENFARLVPRAVRPVFTQRA